MKPDGARSWTQIADVYDLPQVRTFHVRSAAEVSCGEMQLRGAPGGAGACPRARHRRPTDSAMERHVISPAGSRVPRLRASHPQQPDEGLADRALLRLPPGQTSSAVDTVGDRAAGPVSGWCFLGPATVNIGRLSVAPLQEIGLQFETPVHLRQAGLRVSPENGL